MGADLYFRALANGQSERHCCSATSQRPQRVTAADQVGHSFHSHDSTGLCCLKHRLCLSCLLMRKSVAQAFKGGSNRPAPTPSLQPKPPSPSAKGSSERVRVSVGPLQQTFVHVWCYPRLWEWGVSTFLCPIAGRRVCFG